MTAAEGRCQSGTVALSLWRVWREMETEEWDGRSVWALDAKQAVESWAQQEDADDSNYHIANSGSARVFVRGAGAPPAPPVMYLVDGEMTPSYTVRIVKEAYDD